MKKEAVVLTIYNRKAAVSFAFAGNEFKCRWAYSARPKVKRRPQKEYSPINRAGDVSFPHTLHHLHHKLNFLPFLGRKVLL
jgi:hypothetical protein